MSSTRNAEPLMNNQEDGASGVMVIIRKASRDNGTLVAAKGNIIPVDSYKPTSGLENIAIIAQDRTISMRVQVKVRAGGQFRVVSLVP